MDLTKAEYMKEEVARIHLRTIHGSCRSSWSQDHKDLHGPENHDVGITHQEADILECKEKWALGSINTKKS